MRKTKKMTKPQNKVKKEKVRTWIKLFPNGNIFRVWGPTRKYIIRWEQLSYFPKTNKVKKKTK